MTTTALARARGTAALSQAQVDGAARDALLLLAWATDRSVAWLLANPATTIPQESIDRYTTALQRRALHEPVAYIMGTRSWRDMELLVDRRVLIPRPETEELVDLCASLLDSLPLPLHIADVGTGSGALALALAALLPASAPPVRAIDLSSAALDVARGNAARSGLGERMTFEQGWLLSTLPDSWTAALIVANLPYVPSDDIPHLMPDVAAFEPHLALDGGEDGLSLIREMISQARERLRPGGVLALEIGADQADAVREIGERVFGQGAITIHSDLSGRDRFALLRQSRLPL